MNILSKITTGIAARVASRVEVTLEQRDSHMNFELDRIKQQNGDLETILDSMNGKLLALIDMIDDLNNQVIERDNCDGIKADQSLTIDETSGDWDTYRLDDMEDQLNAIRNEYVDLQTEDEVKDLIDTRLGYLTVSIDY